MRQTVKLTQSELKRMISESVKRVLGEHKKYDWSEFEKDPEGKKESDVDNSWEYYDYVHSTPKEVRPYDDAYWNLANREDNNTLLWDLQNNYWDGSSDIDAHMFYDVSPDRWKANKEKKEQDNQKMKNQWEKDKRWQKAADKRPLHRKGSLNRELKESRINRAVNEVVRRILKG